MDLEETLKAKKALLLQKKKKKEELQNQVTSLSESVSNNITANPTSNDTEDPFSDLSILKDKAKFKTNPLVAKNKKEELQNQVTSLSESVSNNATTNPTETDDLFSDLSILKNKAKLKANPLVAKKSMASDIPSSVSDGTPNNDDDSKDPFSDLSILKNKVKFKTNPLVAKKSMATLAEGAPSTSDISSSVSDGADNNDDDSKDDPFSDLSIVKHRLKMKQNPSGPQKQLQLTKQKSFILPSTKKDAVSEIQSFVNPLDETQPFDIFGRESKKASDDIDDLDQETLDFIKEDTSNIPETKTSSAPKENLLQTESEKKVEPPILENEALLGSELLNLIEDRNLLQDEEYVHKLSEQMEEWVNDFDFLERNRKYYLSESINLTLSLEIFESDFFLLEIARLKTKFSFDQQRENNRVTAKQIRDVPLSERSVEELVQLAEMNESFAIEFGEKFEYEWGRVLIESAMKLRKRICAMLSPGGVPIEDIPAPFEDEQEEGKEGEGDEPPKIDAYQQVFHIERYSLFLPTTRH
jgi:hypothetical protein